MTVFENFKAKNIDELVEWMNEHCTFDNAPWWRWWDKHYCNKCDVEIFTDGERETEYAWCELNNDRCKFFKNMEEIPSSKEIIKMWLESEHE